MEVQSGRRTAGQESRICGRKRRRRAGEANQSVGGGRDGRRPARAGGQQRGHVQAFQHLNKADTFVVDEVTAEAKVDNFDALVLPGGVANADQLRGDRDAVDLVGSFFDTGKPVAVICHGPWAIVEADPVRGRTLTSWPTLQADIRNAGGTWVDEEVNVCEGGPSILVSSRKPDDLPSFNTALVSAFAGAREPTGTDARRG